MAAPVHATVVARFGPTGWRGVLLMGPSGAGKSDLALRLIGRGWRLTADDYAHVWRSGEALFAVAPATIEGRIEARGLGVVAAPLHRISRIMAMIDCVQETVERMPDPAVGVVDGVTLPRFQVDVRPASAVEVVAALIAAL